MLSFQIGISGEGQNTLLKGRVVGMSDRIQSLVVPTSFMEWANQRFGTQERRKPSRVVIKTNDASSPALNQFLQKNQLRTDQEKTRFSHYRQVVQWIAGIAGFSGILLLVFALLVLSLFIQLSITGRRDEIRLLLQIGASPDQLSGFLLKKFLPSQIVMVIMGLITVAILQGVLKVWLAKQSIEISPFPSLLTVAATLLLLTVMWVMNRTAIRKTLHS
jgi:cell division protein FtsX